MMILVVNCGCCGVASGYHGFTVWSTTSKYVLRRDWCIIRHCTTVRGGGATYDMADQRAAVRARRPRTAMHHHENFGDNYSMIASFSSPCFNFNNRWHLVRARQIKTRWCMVSYIYAAAPLKEWKNIKESPGSW